MQWAILYLSISSLLSMLLYDRFSSQAWLSDIICICIQKHSSKNEVFKRLWNVLYRLKTYKFLVPAFHKIAISKTTNYFGTFYVFFLVSVNLWHYSPNYSFTSLTRTLLSRISVNSDHDREKKWKNIPRLRKKMFEILKMFGQKSTVFFNADRSSSFLRQQYG